MGEWTAEPASGTDTSVVDSKAVPVSQPSSLLSPPSPLGVTWSSRLGLPVPTPVRVDAEAAEVGAVATAEGEALGFSPRWTAAARVMCGDAIDVPEQVAVAVVEL